MDANISSQTYREKLSSSKNNVVSCEDADKKKKKPQVIHRSILFSVFGWSCFSSCCWTKCGRVFMANKETRKLRRKGMKQGMREREIKRGMLKEYRKEGSQGL